MANGAEVCCALGLCCPPLSASQEDALIAMLVDEGFEPQVAKKLAKWIFKKFDLAEAGTLTELKASVSKLARAHKDHD